LASKVLPALDQLTVEQQNKLLQALAEMSPFASADDARLLLPIIYTLFQSRVPVQDSSEKMDLTSIEALLFTFHHLGSKAPGAVSSLCGVAPIYTGQPSDMITVENADVKLKEFHSRLKLLETKCESYTKDLSNALQTLSQEKEKEKYNIGVVALKTAKNIQDMVKPLLKQKPIFYGRQSGIKLSWEQQKELKRKGTEPKTQTKRMQQRTQQPKTIEGPVPKKQRGGFQGIYTPPAKRGEVPVVATTSNLPTGRGGRGRGGYIRGRGRARGRY